MLLDILDARFRGHDVDSSKVTEFERGLTLSAAFATPDVVTDTDHLHALRQGMVLSRFITLQLSSDSIRCGFTRVEANYHMSLRLMDSVPSSDQGRQHPRRFIYVLLAVYKTACKILPAGSECFQ